MRHALNAPLSPPPSTPPRGRIHLTLNVNMISTVASAGALQMGCGFGERAEDGRQPVGRTNRFPRGYANGNDGRKSSGQGDTIFSYRTVHFVTIQCGTARFVAWFCARMERGGGCTHAMHDRQYILASLQCRDGARRASPTRQTLLAPSAKRHEVFGESHVG